MGSPVNDQPYYIVVALNTRTYAIARRCIGGWYAIAATGITSLEAARIMARDLNAGEKNRAQQA
jgi:hypothetical protein